MKKSIQTILCLLVLLTSSLSLSAQPVSKEAAMQKALAFLTQSDQEVSAARATISKTPKLVLANSREEIFVFNDKTNGGYVVISGDERIPDVLAYSYDGSFDDDSIPSNMKAWMDEYAEQVKYLRTHPEAQMKRKAPVEKVYISPLLTCWFNQGIPYNNKCPKVGDESCLTGCVATAMAQIMYYWQWPKQTSDVIPGYTTKSLKIQMPSIPITTIDWEHILEIYNWGDYNQKQADAISTLMLLCGTSVQMNYNTNESSPAYSSVEAFRYYFGYDDLIEGIGRDSYDADEWEQMIYDELRDGRPVLYYGDKVGPSKSGHAFVIDGYRSNYFHINWGWGGQESYVLMTDVEGWNGYTAHQSAIIGIQPAYPDSPSRYAVLDNGKMSLYYDKERSNRSGTILSRDEWPDYAKEVTECVIDLSFGNLKQRSLAGCFSGFKNMKSIEGIKYLNTDKVKDMQYMFSGCKSLTSLDVSGFKTDNVTDMGYMFDSCWSLTSLDVSGFKTDNVTDMSNMFSNCSSLTSLDVSGFKTDKVTDMAVMFNGCSSLTSLDVSGFKTDNVTSMIAMFSNCSSLTSLDVSGLKTGNVTNMRYMFSNCSSLTSLDLSGFKTDNVTDMYAMFSDCSGLTSLDVSGFKTDNVTSMSNMFSSCSSLTSLDLSGFKTGNVTEMTIMFYGCSNLTSLDLSGFKTDNVTNMRMMFSHCPSLTSLDLNGFKTDNVTDMDGMFEDCYSLASLDISNFNTENVTYMGCMFCACTSLTSLDLSSFKTDNVTDMYAMFYECNQLATICTSERWDMSNVENTESMFLNCNNIVGGKGTTYDANHIDGEYARIDEGSSKPGYFTYKENIDGITPILYDARKLDIYSINGRKIRTASESTEGLPSGIYIIGNKKCIINSNTTRHSSKFANENQK